MAANLARLSDDMAKAKGIVSGAAKDIERSVDFAKKALGALGIGFGVGYFVSLIRGSIDAMDRLNDLSKASNVAVEDLAGLRLAAQQTGGNLDSAADAINKLAQNMGKDAEKFRLLGVTAKSPLEAFKQLADIYVRLQDPQQRAAVMAAALGKAWQGAAPMLAEGGAKLQEMIDKGKLLSGATKEAADRADEFNDRWAEMTTVFASWKTKAVADALPGMTDIVKAMREAAEEGGLLLSVWVGLGGVMAHILGLTERQQTAARLAEINEQLRIAKAQLESGSLNPKGGAKSFWNFLIPDVSLKPEAVARLKETIDALEKEKARLAPPTRPTAAPTAGGADAAAAAAAAARFLGEEKERLKALDAEEKERIRRELATEAKALDAMLKAAEEREAREQEIRDIAHQVRVAEDQRELDQVAHKNAERARMEQDALQATFDRIDAEQEAAIEHGQMLLDIERWVAENRKRIQQGFMDFLGNVAGLMNTQSKKVFEIGKIGALAQAGVTGALAVMEAWRAGMQTKGPWAPAVAALYAAAAAANALNLMNNIRKQTFGGGAGAPTPVGQGASGVAGGGLGGAALGAPTQGSSIVLNLTVNGHILDTQEFTDTVLVPSLRDAIDNRDVTIIGADSRQAADLQTA